MSTAAQFNAKFTHRQDPDTLAVLFAKQRHGTLFDGGVHIRYQGFDRVVGTNLGIDHGFDLDQLIRCNCTGMAKVKTQTVRIV